MQYLKLKKEHPTPLYVQLYGIIKKNIYEGSLRENDPIPSESQLMKAYDVSRITVRNALARLEFDGLVYKVHGRGSFVCKNRIIEIPSPAISFQKQMADQGFSLTSKFVEFSAVYPSEGVLKRLNLKNGDKADKIKRLIILENKNIGLSVMFVPRDFGRRLTDIDLNTVDLVDHFNQNPETIISKMDVLVWAAAIEEVDAETMGVDSNSTVLVRACTYWNRLGRPIMAGKVLYLSQYTAINMVIDAEKNPLQVKVGDVYQEKLNT